MPWVIYNKETGDYLKFLDEGNLYFEMTTQQRDAKEYKKSSVASRQLVLLKKAMGTSKQLEIVQVK